MQALRGAPAQAGRGAAVARRRGAAVAPGPQGSAPRRRLRAPLVVASTRLPGVPNYSYDESDVPGQQKPRLEDPHDRLRREAAELQAGQPQQPQRKWWDYGVKQVGIPQVGISQVTTPQYSPGGGDGGSSGSGGRGGGGGGGGGGSGSSGGGGPMRGFTYLFAAFLMAGGLMAFFRRGSTKSMLFSAAAAMLLLIAASLMHRRIGTLLALGTCLGLGITMGQRANTSRKVFPAGVVAILSALMSIGYTRQLV